MTRTCSASANGDPRRHQREPAGPGYELADVDAALLGVAADVVEQFVDQNIGVTDASIVLARRYRSDRVLTLDRRRFDVLRTADGAPFTVLP